MADIQMVPLPGHSSMGDTYIDSDGDVDAVGNRFSLLAEAQPGNGNITFATLRKIAPNGTVLGTWTFRPTANQKIDKANMLRSGRDVIVECITHAITSTKPRQLHKETNKVEGVWVTTSSFESERGGAGAFVPTGVPEEGGVTKEEVQTIVSAAQASIISTVVGNIIPKVQYAFINGLDDENEDDLAERFRGALFPYLKNAAANPLANVLGGGDAWGVARREELKAIIQEAIEELGELEEPTG